MREPDPAASATGPLRDFSLAGALTWADVHPAQQLAHLFAEKDPRVHLALALTVRALRAGSICLDLARVRDLEVGEESVAEIPESWWPEPAGWLAALQASPLVTVGDTAPGSRPLRLVDGALYLERHFADQESVRRQLLSRLSDAPATGEPRVGQQAAIDLALTSPVSVIAGGPGTGKTWTIRAIIEQLRATSPGLLIGLAAPTGKAAARMTESLGQGAIPAVTIHRLLGWNRHSRSRFAHDATHPLPHDVIVIDEMSMVSMLLMERLLSALKPSARLVLVGDPDQLASVDAGSVLADITVSPAARGIVARLEHNYRFGGQLQSLASAIRAGDADAALAVLAAGDEARLVPQPHAAAVLRPRIVGPSRALQAASFARDPARALAALDAHRLLCGHREGPFGVRHWTRQIQAWLARDVPGFSADGEFPPGRPVMVTANAPNLGLYNGDTGVVLADEPAPRAWFMVAGRPRAYPPFLLDGLTPVYAMTVHKAQGSQFDDVSVVLPPPGSPLLTRELLYTAVTRSKRTVVLVGEPDAVREAVDRPARRMSGLAHRLA